MVAGAPGATDPLLRSWQPPSRPETRVSLMPCFLAWLATYPHHRQRPSLGPLSQARATFHHSTSHRSSSEADHYLSHPQYNKPGPHSPFPSSNQHLLSPFRSSPSVRTFSPHLNSAMTGTFDLASGHLACRNAVCSQLSANAAVTP